VLSCLEVQRRLFRHQEDLPGGNRHRRRLSLVTGRGASAGQVLPPELDVRSTSSCASRRPAARALASECVRRGAESMSGVWLLRKSKRSAPQSVR
jgi:hypothetical protein